MRVCPRAIIINHSQSKCQIFFEAHSDPRDRLLQRGNSVAGDEETSLLAHWKLPVSWITKQRPWRETGSLSLSRWVYQMPTGTDSIDRSSCARHSRISEMGWIGVYLDPRGSVQSQYDTAKSFIMLHECLGGIGNCWSAAKLFPFGASMWGQTKVQTRVLRLWLECFSLGRESRMAHNESVNTISRLLATGFVW